MEMAAADKVATDVDDLDKAEEHVTVAVEPIINTRDCAVPLVTVCLITDRKGPLIK